MLLRLTMLIRHFLNDDMPNMSGTSAAAPHAAGVVALLLESNPELQPVDIKKILQDTAIDIFQRNNDEKTETGNGFDFDSGYGLIFVSMYSKSISGAIIFETVKLKVAP